MSDSEARKRFRVIEGGQAAKPPAKPAAQPDEGAEVVPVCHGRPMANLGNVYQCSCGRRVPRGSPGGASRW
ncbi:MAG: hypothetical protein HYU66_07375 [Armatimonadetes bacterium]|nr:hypothetical protein [Armatimonadota bacterium]